jgi:hypothetical protein
LFRQSIRKKDKQIFWQSKVWGQKNGPGEKAYIINPKFMGAYVVNAEG